MSFAELSFSIIRLHSLVQLKSSTEEQERVLDRYCQVGWGGVYLGPNVLRSLPAEPESPHESLHQLRTRHEELRKAEVFLTHWVRLIAILERASSRTTR